ncbi:MAG: hypothetical protein WCX81_03925 [Monoglobales bacterium]
MKKNYYSRYELAPAPDPPVKKESNNLTGLSGLAGNLFSNFCIDDLILIALIFILVTDEHPDLITILTLVYIFFV